MKRHMTALAVSAMISVAAPALAQDGSNGFYAGIRGIGSIAQVDDVNTSGFVGTETIENDDDRVVGAGGIVGYRWEDFPLRTEIEASYRFRFDVDVRDRGAPVIDYESNVATTAVLFNAFLEWRNESDFTPFVGGSVGWARNSAENDRVNLGTAAHESQDTDEDNLAWGVMAGVDWLFLDDVSAELAYRFINLGDVDLGSFSGGDSVDADDYTSHEILLSVSYRF